MALRFELSGVLHDAIYILMGSAMSTWNQIAKNGQQKERLGNKSFPERSTDSVLSPRRSWGAAAGESFA